MEIGSIGDWAGVVISVVGLILTVIFEWKRLEDVPPGIVKFLRSLAIGIVIGLAFWIVYQIGSLRNSSQTEIEVTREVAVTELIESTKLVEVTREVTREVLGTIEVTRIVTESVEITGVVAEPVEVTRIVEVEVTSPSAGEAVVQTVVVTATPTPAPTLSSDVLFLDDFEDGNANGWNSPTPNDWNVVAIGENYEFTCISARTQYGDQELTDYRISADMRTINNDVNMGVIGRFVNGDLFYLANLNGSEAKILRKRSGDRWTDIGVVGYSAVPNTVYNVALDMQGTILTMYVNGEQVLQVEDAIIGSGKFGLRCGDNTQGTFDNVIVESR